MTDPGPKFPPPPRSEADIIARVHEAATLNQLNFVDWWWHRHDEQSLAHCLLDLDAAAAEEWVSLDHDVTLSPPQRMAMHQTVVDEYIHESDAAWKDFVEREREREKVVQARRKELEPEDPVNP